MEIPQVPWRIVVLPRPLSPLAAFAYFLLSEATFEQHGSTFKILGPHYVRWATLVPSMSVSSDGAFPEFGVSINLNCSQRDLRELVTYLFSLNPQFDDKPLPKRLSNFFCFGNHRHTVAKSWLTFTGKLSRNNNLNHVVALTNNLIQTFIREEKDFFEHAVEERQELPFSFDVPVASDTLEISVPVTKRVHIEGGRALEAVREETQHTIQALRESEIFWLMRSKIVILIGGPPQMGKSTIAASLYTQLKHLIRSLQSRSGACWSDLRLRVGLTTLDLATPVADEMLKKGQAKDRALMQSRKQPWTEQLAREALLNMEKVLQLNDIVIADLPGKLTDITRLLGAFGTHAIIVGQSNDEEFSETQQSWNRYFSELGINVVGQIKSTEHQPSMMSLYRPGRRIYGRVRRPERVVRAWDPFITVMGQFLMFEILPSLMRNLHERIEEQT
ncbi:MAG: hypothetical protein RL094_481 [Candidatus Parcubacteria bacterium]